MMFNTLKYFKHIVITGAIPDSVLSDLLDCTNHEITDNFNHLNVKSLIFPDSIPIPFDKLELDDTFFIDYDNSYQFDKVKYGYQHLSDIPDNLTLQQFVVYHSHLGNKKVLHFECDNGIHIDIINNNQVLIDFKPISKDELKFLRPFLPKGAIFFFQGLTLSNKVKGQKLNIKLDSVGVDDITYLLLTLNDKNIFPFRFQGNTDFSFFYYQLKLKPILSL